MLTSAVLPGNSQLRTGTPSRVTAKATTTCGAHPPSLPWHILRSVALGAESSSASTWKEAVVVYRPNEGLIIVDSVDSVDSVYAVYPVYVGRAPIFTCFAQVRAKIDEFCHEEYGVGENCSAWLKWRGDDCNTALICNSYTDQSHRSLYKAYIFIPSIVYQKPPKKLFLRFFIAAPAGQPDVLLTSAFD